MLPMTRGVPIPPVVAVATSEPRPLLYLACIRGLYDCSKTLITHLCDYTSTPREYGDDMVELACMLISHVTGHSPNDALDHLAVEFQHKTQHAMRSRMLRAKIDREIADG